jgi:hypothetical protein
MATVGRPPVANTTFGLQDGRWLLGVANGLNRSSQNGIIAHSGGSKAAAFQLPANVAQFQVDTVAADNDSVLMPAAKAGQSVAVFNNGGHILAIYGRGTDTINAQTTATALSLAAPATSAGVGSNAFFFCSTDGKWSAIKG